MNFDARDLRKLQGSLLLAIALIGAGAAMVWWTLAELRGAEQAAREAEARHRDITDRLRRVRDEEIEIKTKTKTFQAIAARGIIGPEQRLEWVELIGDVRRQRRLLDPEYEFQPQASLGGRLGDFQFVASPMALRLPLLHEGDLLGFLGDLQARAPALVQPRECQVERRPGPAQRGGPPANLLATCELQWITIRRSGSAGDGGNGRRGERS